MLNLKTDKEAIERLLHSYADVLNKANLKLISNFYTADAVFMPNGIKSLPAAKLGTKGKNFLDKNRFHIGYEMIDINVDGIQASVIARAKATTTDLHTGTSTLQISRDFFVLKKIAGEWKIYRYIFNSIN